MAHRSGIMVRNFAHVAWSGVALAAFSFPALAQQTNGVEPVTSDVADRQTEIVVTASKREELLRDVPAAVTAITSDTIETAGIQDFRDYATLVPGLSQRDLGSPGQGTIILRGLNTGAQQTTNTAAFYIDDAQVSSSGYLGIGSVFTPNPDLGDVERIEVLKGPQGTLFGANSLGGIVRIVSRAPNASEFQGSLRAEISDTRHGDIGYSGRGSINLPLIDGKLAVRASGSYRRIGGFTDNVGTGNNNVNDADIYGGRAALRFTPSEQLSFELSAFLQNVDSTTFAYQDNVSGTLTPLYGRYRFSQFDDFKNKIRNRIYTATADYDFGAVSLISTLSYGQVKTNISNDYTPSYVPLVAALVPAGTLGLGNTSPNTNKWTFETRLVSERIGAFEFILGGFYTTEKSEYGTTILLLNGATRAQLAGPFGTLLRTATLSDYKEYAGFGNVTFYLSESFDLTGGIRVARNRDLSTTGAPLDGIPASVFFAPRTPSSFRSTETPITYLAAARWRPTDQLSFFARAASGYRPGGPQTNGNPPAGAQTSILSDSVWNYEIGAKGTLLDGQLAFEASAYHIDWSDIQLNTLFGGTILGSNAGEATVDGLELSFTARPSPMLSISSSFGYTDAKFKSISAGASANLGAVAGDALPLTPKYTVALLADQRIPLSGDVEASVGATLRFQSDMISGFPGNPLDPGLKIPSYETVDLRTSVKFSNFAVQLRADNVFDRFGYSSLSTARVFPGQQVPTIGTVIRPRTLTLSLSTDF